MGILCQAFAATEARPDDVPARFKTCRQWAEQEGLSPVTVRAKLAVLVERGEWEVRPFRVLSGQRVLPVPHYGPKIKPKAKAN